MAVDLSSLAYRSYYGLPDSIKSADGKPVNAIKGYLDAINRFIKLHKPSSVIHALDYDWRPQWRVDLLPEYKLHRVIETDEEDVPDDLEYQIEVLPQILSDMGMQNIGVKDAEADDVLATIATKFDDVIVITGDRDLLQLINDQRNIAVHQLGKEGGKLFRDKDVEDKYGIKAQQYIDFSVLKGDPSDGLPGVKGIGEKTSAKIISKYGHIQNMMNNLNDDFFTKRHREAIIESMKYIRNAMSVVELKKDLEISNSDKKVRIDLDSLKSKYKNLKMDNQFSEYEEIISSSPIFSTTKGS
jgi:5'-3' exonuclease